MLKSIILLCLISCRYVLGHGSTSVHNGDEFESQSSNGTMYNLPIFINFDGSISYGIGLMDHVNHSDINHGGMDHGEMNHNETNHGDMSTNINNDMDHDSSHGSMNHRSSSKIAWHIMPMVHLGFDKNKRIVSLAKNTNNNKNFAASDKKGEYLTIENRRIESGAGLMLMGMPTSINWGGFFQIGFMPYKGSYLFSKQKVSGYKKAQSVLPLSFPTSKGELNNWSNSDKLVTTVHGGIMMGAGLGATIFTDLSANYMTNGSWRIEAVKSAPNKITVSVDQSDLEHIMYNFGATIISTNIGNHQLKSVHLKFEFDLSKEQGLSSYLNLLQGDLNFAEQLIEKEIEGVKDLTNVITNETGRMRTSKLGVAVLFSRNEMKMDTYSESRSLILESESNKELKSSMKMIHVERNTHGFFSKHMKNYKMYMQGSFLFDNEVFNTNSFVWLFERNRTSCKKLSSKISKWSKTLLLKTQAILESCKGNLGYSRTLANMVLRPSAILKLKEIQESLKIEKYDDLIKKMLKSRKYFDKVIDQLDNDDYVYTFEIVSEKYQKITL